MRNRKKILRATKSYGEWSDIEDAKLPQIIFRKVM